MSDPALEPTPPIQPAVARPPPGWAAAAPREREERPAGPGQTVYLLEPVLVRDLARALGKKPFAIVADLLALKRFKSADEEIDFETAARIARKHGYRAERPPPGVLVL